MKNTKYKYNKKGNFKKLLLAGIILVLVAGGSAYAFYSNRPDTNTSDNSLQNHNDDGVPTEETREDTGSIKEHISENDSQASQPTSQSGLKTVTPEINSLEQYDGSVEASSRVPGIIEETGTCKLTLEKDGKKVSVSKEAVPNVSEMSCGFMSIKVSKLSKGVWKASVSYSSKKANGTSMPESISVK